MQWYCSLFRLSITAVYETSFAVSMSSLSLYSILFPDCLFMDTSGIE